MIGIKSIHYRGLCSESILDRYYKPINGQGGHFMYAGDQGTFILYNHTERAWVAKRKASPVEARSSSSYEDMLFGLKEWNIDNDNCKYGRKNKVKLSLSTCSLSEFSCYNGLCLDIKGRCNGTKECSDGSDEYDCITLKLSPSYKNEKPPLEGEIMHVNVSVKVENILMIKETDNEFRARFKIFLYCHDERITFYDLSQVHSSNELSSHDYEKIWRPKLAYRDMNIYHRDINSDPFIHISTENYTFSTLDISHLHNSKIFNDGLTSLKLNTAIR